MTVTQGQITQAASLEFVTTLRARLYLQLQERGDDSMRRNDLQGLRAICVIAVVLHHIKTPGFSGGFIGVDIFFVLSGFFITQLLANEMESIGQLNIVSFWARRAKRLLPNAILTILATILLSVFLAPATSKLSFAKDGAYAAIYAANYHFAYRAADYFDSDGSLSPYIHFWSLSVEEQFYILMPLLMMLALPLFKSDHKRILLPLLAIISCCSFATSVYFMGHSQPDAFFHSESRFWQIAVGGMLALTPAHGKHLSPTQSKLLTWSGSLGLIAALILYNDRMPYPGIWALPPAMIAAALIIGGLAGNSMPYRILASRPLKAIGDYSYSIYLWHWPLIVFARLAYPGSAAAGLLAIALLVPVSVLAYRFVETPIRHSSRLSSSPLILILIAIAASLATAGLSLFGSWVDLGGANTKGMRDKVAIAQTDFPKMGRCDLSSTDEDFAPCLFAATTAPHRLVVFGDSFGAQLFPAVEDAAKRVGWALQMRTKDGCPPIDYYAFDYQLGALNTSCRNWREKVFAEMTAEKPDLVVIASWSGVARRMYDPKANAPLRQAESEQAWLGGLETVLRHLRELSIPVVVVKSTPRSRASVLDCLAKDGPDSCNRPRQEATQDMPIEFLAAHEVVGTETLDLTDRFCGRNVCNAVIDGRIVYRDNKGHITATFAKTLEPAFSELLRGHSRR